MGARQQPTDQKNIPAEAQSGVDAIAASYDHSLALKDGKVIAWGANYYGQIDVPKAARSSIDRDQLPARATASR